MYASEEIKKNNKKNFLWKIDTGSSRLNSTFLESSDGDSSQSQQRGCQ
jgi:hypothetical protein